MPASKLARALMGFSTDPPFIPDAAHAICSDNAVVILHMLLVCNHAVLICSNAGISVTFSEGQSMAWGPDQMPNACPRCHGVRKIGEPVQACCSARAKIVAVYPMCWPQFELCYLHQTKLLPLD